MKRYSSVFALALLIAVGAAGTQTASASSVRTLNENSVNKTYAVKVGSHLTLTLHSMFWSLTASVKNSGISQVGAVLAKPILPGPTAPKGCGLPGMGCGTQTWNFVAKKSGTYVIAASRTSCGEALQCIGTQGVYAVTVRVLK